VKTLLVASIVGGTAALSACAGLTQMQDTAAKFDQGVHYAGAAELSFYNQVRSAECTRDFYRNGFDFATATRDPKTKQYVPNISLDLRSVACSNKELTDDELALREKLLSTITLYADAIQTLTNGTSDKSLSDKASDLADNIKTLGTQQKFPGTAATDIAALNAAVITLTTMILDHRSYQHVKDAAQAMKSPLSQVVEALKAENLADAVGLASKADGLVNEVKTGLDSARDQFGAASFLEVIFAREALQSLIVTPPDVKGLNDTLDAIVAANTALARSTEGGAIPEISDLTSRAQQASALFNAAK
jgi:hypothetical protein